MFTMNERNGQVDIEASESDEQYREALRSFAGLGDGADNGTPQSLALSGTAAVLPEEE
jgi:hypothetical protein